MAAGLPVVQLIAFILVLNGTGGIVSNSPLGQEPNLLKQNRLELPPVSGRMEELVEELNNSLARSQSA